MTQSTLPPEFRIDCNDCGVAHLQLCRPDSMNMFSAAFWTDLPTAVTTLSATGNARALIFSSTGKHFSAGMDLQVFHQLLKDFDREPSRQGERLRRWVLDLQQAASCLEQARMPVIAAVQGGCIGGGLDLICAADIRLCTADAFFSIKEIALAITADLGTLQRIQQVMPSGLARELAYTGRNMSAEEALRCGFVNRVFDTQEQMLLAANELAAEIAGHSPVAVNGVKEMLNYSRDHSIQDSLNLMATWQAGMFQAADLAEALSAGKERRSPQYDDLFPQK